MFTVFNTIIISLSLLGVFAFGVHMFVRQAELDARIHRLERDKFIRDNYDGDVEAWKEATQKKKKK